MWTIVRDRSVNICIQKCESFKRLKIVRRTSNLLVANMYWMIAFKIHVFDTSLVKETPNRSNSECWSDVDVTISTQTFYPVSLFKRVSVNLISSKNVLVETRRVIFDLWTNSTLWRNNETRNKIEVYGIKVLSKYALLKLAV